jgi:hypothetical protein
MSLKIENDHFAAALRDRKSWGLKWKPHSEGWFILDSHGDISQIYIPDMKPFVSAKCLVWKMSPRSIYLAAEDYPIVRCIYAEASGVAKLFSEAVRKGKASFARLEEVAKAVTVNEDIFISRILNIMLDMAGKAKQSPLWGRLI